MMTDGNSGEKNAAGKKAKRDWILREYETMMKCSKLLKESEMKIRAG